MSPIQPAWLHDTVSALAYSIAGQHRLATQDQLQPPFNDITLFILEQEGRLPDTLRSPLALATLGFDLAALPGGSRFHTAAPEVRSRILTAWKRSTLGFKRDLIRYHESLATLALFSRAEERMQGDSAVEGRMRQPPERIQSQVAVIGSGPGGTITACLLAERGRSVVLLEEGPFLPLESCAPFSRQELEQKYRNGGQTVALGQNKVAYVEGRCVGGGSEVNSGLYHRTPPEVLELWRREYGVQELSESDLLSHQQACERELSVSMLPGPPAAASSKLASGAQKLGWQALEVPRWFSYSPNGATGTRQSMTKTYIPRFLKAGGTLVPNTRATALRQENGRWIIDGRVGGRQPLTVEAGTVFVAAGAVQTPALLRRSGITTNIGNALRLHPTVKLVAEFPEEVNSADMGVPVHQVKEFAPRLTFGCSISTVPYLALGLLDHPSAIPLLPTNWTRLANYYAMCAAEGLGTVRCLPTRSDPLVRYRLSESDRTQLAHGMKKLAELLFAAGASAIYPGVQGSAAVRKPKDLDQMSDILPQGKGNLMTIHLFSTCPMGEDRHRCAVDSFGKVHGMQGLFVADASLLCTAPGVNPQGSIMALVRRNVLRFLGQS